jgi:predicted  nucleic acid-binding Zn-ribbon protein
MADEHRECKYSELVGRMKAEISHSKEKIHTLQIDLTKLVDKFDNLELETSNNITELTTKMEGICKTLSDNVTNVENFLSAFQKVKMDTQINIDAIKSKDGLTDRTIALEKNVKSIDNTLTKWKGYFKGASWFIGAISIVTLFFSFIKQIVHFLETIISHMDK